MNVETASQKLVHKVLTVIISQILSRLDNPMHICLHKICDDVDVLVACWGWWLLDINKSDDIFVIEEFYQK